MIQLNPEIFERIQAIDWCVHCGEPLNFALRLEMVRAASWKDALKSRRKQAWDFAMLEARNELTMHLAFRHKQLYNGVWNPLVLEAKEFIGREVLPKITSIEQSMTPPAELKADVEWNLMAVFMEDAYREYDPPHDFFHQLLRVYEAGHLPCGWTGGEWPVGSLVVL